MSISGFLNKKALNCFIIVFVIVAADQISKNYLLDGIGLGNSQDFIPGIVQFNLVQNTGGAFSIFKQYPFFFKAIGTVNVLIFSLLTFANTLKVNNIIRAGFSCVLGGTLGNLADRYFKDGVIDFIDLIFVNFAIFNVADVFIDIGVGLILIGWCFFSKK